MQLDPSHLIFFALTMLTMLIAYRNGKSLANYKRKEIKIRDFLPTIIAYTLFAGLRWGRGFDYNSYYSAYKDISNGLNEGWEPLFYIICRILSILGLPWQAMVMFMSFLLIFSLCRYFKNLKSRLYVVLPFLVTNLNDAENTMRWFMAFSLFMLAASAYHSQGTKRICNSIILLIACFFTHYGFIIPMVIFIGLHLLNEHIDIKPHIVMTLYLIVTFMFKNDMMMYFDSYIQEINLGIRFAMYQNNSEAWLTGAANDFNENFTGFSLTKFLPNVVIIYLGAMWRDICNSKREKMLYTLAVFSIIFSPIASQIELLYRVNAVFAIFKAIIIASFFDAYRKKLFRSTTVNILLLTVFLLKIYTITTYPLVCSRFNTYYIWDAHGRKTLDRGL